jgi:hypothetical protein
MLTAAAAEAGLACAGLSKGVLTSLKIFAQRCFTSQITQALSLSQCDDLGRKRALPAFGGRVTQTIPMKFVDGLFKNRE